MRPVVLVLVLASLAGCAGSPVMTRAPVGEPPAGSRGVATIVFLRPSTFAFSVRFRVIDHSGRFVGDALPDSYFVVTSKPGEFVFVLDDADTDVLYASVAEGRVYYVEIVPVPGSFEQAAILRPVKPRGRDWDSLAKILSRTRQFIPDFARGQASVDQDPDVPGRIQRAKSKWAALSPSERAERSILPDEGAPAPASQPPPGAFPWVGSVPPYAAPNAAYPTPSSGAVAPGRSPGAPSAPQSGTSAPESAVPNAPYGASPTAPERQSH